MAKVLMKPQTSIVHMVISSISKLATIHSPTVFIHGIPWEIAVHKNEDENSLAIFLQCAKEDDSSNWAVPACATINLLPRKIKKNALKRNIGPFVFTSSTISFGFDSFIQLDDLLKVENDYVQDDTIELKVEITAEDPNYVNRSILKFESIDKSCDCGSLATYRLVVTNVENLMAIRSLQFIVRGLPWTCTIYKHQKSTLGIMLELKESDVEVSCKATMSLKLMSSKRDVAPIEVSDTDRVEWLKDLDIENIISWDEMLKPEKGFVNNNSITLEVKVEVDKPEGDVSNADRNNAASCRRLECSICLEDMDNQDISSTSCGHMFCTACITTAVEDRGVCPLCKATVQLNDLRRLYLPTGK